MGLEKTCISSKGKNCKIKFLTEAQFSWILFKNFEQYLWIETEKFWLETITFNKSFSIR